MLNISNFLLPDERKLRRAVTGGFGRFWAIAGESDDEEEDAGGSSPSPLSARSVAYLCRSPTPIPCDLQDLSSHSLKKKERKRRVQRETATLMRGMVYRILLQELRMRKGNCRYSLRRRSAWRPSMQWNGSRYSEDVERYIFNQIAHVGVDPKSCQHVRWMINGAVIAVYFQIAIGWARWAIIVMGFYQSKRWALSHDL
jgi:hypothetical protein